MTGPPRTLSIRVAPLPGEGLDSWLEAVARRCWMPFPALIEAFGLPTRTGTHRLITSLGEQDLRRLEIRLALPAGRLDEAVLPCDLFGRRSPRCRFCPQCLAETQGRWNLRWWLPWTFACTRHKALLHLLCPGCGSVPRQRIPGPVHRHRPSQCLHKTVPKTNDLCGTDLSNVAPLRLSPQHPLNAVQQQLDGVDLQGQDASSRIFTTVDRLLAQLEGELPESHTADMDPVSRRAWELVSGQATDHASLFGSWRARERTRTTITPQFLHREYDANNRSLLQISKELGVPYVMVIERYKELGRDLKLGSRPRSLDDHWLRE
ncbi:TniQ family protein [Streptomyces goshikiensis]